MTTDEKVKELRAMAKQFLSPNSSGAKLFNECADELEATAKDKERLDLQETMCWSVQWNGRHQKWTVQEREQVVGNIGNGITLRAALDVAKEAP